MQIERDAFEGVTVFRPIPSDHRALKNVSLKMDRQQSNAPAADILAGMSLN